MIGNQHLYTVFMLSNGRRSIEDFTTREYWKQCYSYRKIDEADEQHGKNNIVFAQELFEYIQSTSTCSVIIADISKFFNTLNHKFLKEKVATILGDRLSDNEYKVFESLTSFRYVLNDSRQKKNLSTYEKFVSRFTRGESKQMFIGTGNHMNLDAMKLLRRTARLSEYHKGYL